MRALPQPPTPEPGQPTLAPQTTLKDALSMMLDADVQAALIKQISTRWAAGAGVRDVGDLVDDHERKGLPWNVDAVPSSSTSSIE